MSMQTRTVMDAVAEGAHQGMTVQMEHTPCKDPLTNEAAFISKLHFFLHYLCCMAQSALLR